MGSWSDGSTSRICFAVVPGETFDDGERVETLEHLATLYEEKLDDIVEAITSTTRFCHHSRTTSGAIVFAGAALRGCAVERPRGYLAPEADEFGRRDRGGARRDRAQARRSASRVSSSRSSRRSICIARYCRERRSPEAIDALEELAEDENWAPQVEQQLQEYYSAQHEWERLVELYETRSEQSYDPTEKSEYIEKVAAVYRDGLNEREDALDALARSWNRPLARGRPRSTRVPGPGRGRVARLAEVYEDVLTGALGSRAYPGAAPRAR